MERTFVIRAGQLCCLLISGRFTRHLVPVISVSVHWSGVVLGEPSLGLWAWIAMFWDPISFCRFSNLKNLSSPKLALFQGVFSVFVIQSRVTEDFSNSLTS